MTKLTKNAKREDLKLLQDMMQEIQCPMPEPAHLFVPGVYARTLTLPAGMLTVGKIHKHKHIMVVLKGHAEVVTEFGRDEVRGGDVFVSPAGAKRAVLCFEDTTFLTIHHNPENFEDLELIEEQHIEREELRLTSQKVLER